MKLTNEYQYLSSGLWTACPFDESEMLDLRRLSTCAEISPGRFVNVYHWGNFIGHPRVRALGLAILGLS